MLSFLCCLHVGVSQRGLFRRINHQVKHPVIAWGVSGMGKLVPVGYGTVYELVQVVDLPVAPVQRAGVSARTQGVPSGSGLHQRVDKIARGHRLRLRDCSSAGRVPVIQRCSLPASFDWPKLVTNVKSRERKRLDNCEVSLRRRVVFDASEC